MMMDRVFPTIDPLERTTLLTLVVPAIHKAIGTKAAPWTPVPFDNGGPGMTNSVGHVKRHFHILDDRNALSPLREIGTDPARAVAANPEVLKVIGTVRIGTMITAENQGGYVAPTLKATWVTAPYLHNGSVPTLWHLMHPDERPARFEQGGHALDYDKVGIAGVKDGDLYRYPDGYTPWMRKDVVDTTGPGRTHVGHTSPFSEMSEDEKADVTELLTLF